MKSFIEKIKQHHCHTPRRTLGVSIAIGVALALALKSFLLGFIIGFILWFSAKSQS